MVVTNKRVSVCAFHLLGGEETRGERREEGMVVCGQGRVLTNRNKPNEAGSREYLKTSRALYS